MSSLEQIPPKLFGGLLAAGPAQFLGGSGLLTPMHRIFETALNHADGLNIERPLKGASEAARLKEVLDSRMLLRRALFELFHPKFQQRGVAPNPPTACCLCRHVVVYQRAEPLQVVLSRPSHTARRGSTQEVGRSLARTPRLPFARKCGPAVQAKPRQQTVESGHVAAFIIHVKGGRV